MTLAPISRPRLTIFVCRFYYPICQLGLVAKLLQLLSPITLNEMPFAYRPHC